MTFWKHFSKKNVNPQRPERPKPTPPKPTPKPKVDESPGFCYQLKQDKGWTTSELNRLSITDKASCEYTFSPFDQVVGCHYMDTNTQNAKDICYDYYGSSHKAIIFNGNDTGFCFALRKNSDNACVIELGENRKADVEPTFKIPSDVEDTIKKYSNE